MIDPAPPAAGPRLANTVALVTGAAQGQGAAYARGLAQHGADVIVVDVCRHDPVVSYPLGTRTGLDDIARSIESLGRRCTTVVADVRDAEAMRAAVAAAVEAHGLTSHRRGLGCHHRDESYRRLELEQGCGWARPCLSGAARRYRQSASTIHAKPNNV